MNERSGQKDWKELSAVVKNLESMSVKPIRGSPATKPTRRTLVFAISLVILAAFAGQGCNRSGEDAQARRMAASVKAEFLHAWRNYERYAWGHDALQPLSKTPHDWYEQSLLMTPVDALDTLVLMNLDADVAKTKEL
ncbi:MAG TPA: glycoside hydrolase family 47 protein, partial [Candidatus Baltobacteraceae bacterium]|nr:glycoside hydrolase family 47 protein [Candidatus Baltobacteraceae bacterium]